MAHVMKHTKAACGHMFAHYDRAAGDSINNENIDSSRTHLNYNLAADLQPLSQGEFVRKRCSEVRCQNRKDVNVMCSWVLTATKELTEDEKPLFFQEGYKFLTERYGKENVISSWVHRDEITDHLHYAFVPVVFDEKKQRYKVSAKEAVSRKDLATFHQDLSEHMQKVFGRDIGILNEATKEGNKTVAQLKQETALKKVKASEERAAAAEQRAAAAEQKAAEAEKEAEYLRSRVKPPEAIEAIEGKKGLFNHRTLSEDDFRALKDTASAVSVVRDYNDSQEDYIQQLLDYIDEIEPYKQNQLEKDIKISKLQKELDGYERVVKELQKEQAELVSVLVQQSAMLERIMQTQSLIPKFVREKEFLAEVEKISGFYYPTMKEWSKGFNHERHMLSELEDRMQHWVNSANLVKKQIEKER